MLTARGKLALLLAGATYVTAWAFGTRSLYPVATGLALAVLLGWLWVRIVQQPVLLRRSLGSGEHLEGEDVLVELDAIPARRPGPRSLEVVEDAGRLGELRVTLSSQGGRLTSRYLLGEVPRGLYRLGGARAVFEDPFSFAHAEDRLGTESTLLVYPRLVGLDTLFSELGGATQEGGRLLLRRMSGFDLHSVRDYQQGESLRKVHWKTTARRGTLMVKELEDAPHDEVAVLLDARAAAGETSREVFDVQVRAAGSILRLQALRGRRGVLTVTSSVPESRRVTSFDGEWRLALELLAAAEATGSEPPERFLARDASPASHAAELFVVTSSLSPRLTDALVERANARRAVSLVLVDAASFAGAAAMARNPALLRLQAAGATLAIVRRGDDLAAKLSGLTEAIASHG